MSRGGPGNRSQMHHFEVEEAPTRSAPRGGAMANLPQPVIIGGGVLALGLVAAIGVAVGTSSAGASGGTQVPTFAPTISPTAPPPTPPTDPPPTPPPTRAPTVPTSVPTLAPTEVPSTQAPTPAEAAVPRGPPQVQCPPIATPELPPSPPGPPRQVMKSIAYGPAPLKEEGTSHLLPHDDFFTDDAAPMWKDRGDLAIIKSMGANGVRLYGNHALKNHTWFLDEAHKMGLEVIAGMSDWPYTQAPDNCGYTTNNDCYEQVKATYGLNLDLGGFIDNVTKKYHPAMRRFIIVNEPDIKLGGNDPKKYQKALISAFDGVLDAEKERGMDERDHLNEMVKFTITFSFALCTSCLCYSSRPGEARGGLAQMYDFRHACQYPEQYDYKPRNDLWIAFQMRFENSCNTFNPSSDIAPMFLADYELAFKDTQTHVYFGEYHNVLLQGTAKTQEDDIKAILKMAERPDSLFDGISYFEFQIRYDKGGTETEFGIFGLGSNGTDFNFNGSNFTAYCLTENPDVRSHEIVHEAVTRGFGGPGYATADAVPLCGIEPTHPPTPPHFIE